MRRVRPDPIPLDVQARILDAAIRAPTGGNTQNWRFLLVDDRDVVGRIGPLYRHAIGQLWTTVYADRLAAAAADPGAAESIEMLKVQRSAQWLADHFEEVPLFLFAFVQADPTGGSIFPAVWSAQLAARAEGWAAHSPWSSGVFHPDEIFDILGVPRDEHWVMACCVSFGYPTGGGASRPADRSTRSPTETGGDRRWASPSTSPSGRRDSLWGPIDSGRPNRPPSACGCSSMVEPLPSKQMTRVRSPSAALPGVSPIRWTGPGAAPGDGALSVAIGLSRRYFSK